MIKWILVAIFVIPRIIYSQIVLLIMNANKKVFGIEKRYKVVRNTIRWLNVFLRVDLNVINKEIINKTQQDGQGRIYVANHLNIYDVLALIIIFEKPLIFVSKKENSKVPFLNTHLKAIDTLSIDREDPRQSLKICKEAGLLVKSGKNIVIFAEGTRSKDGRVAPFKAALKTMVHYSQSEIVLICVHNTSAPLSFHLFKYPKERVNVRVFETIPYSFYLENRKDFNEILREQLQKQVDEFDLLNKKLKDK